VKYVGFFSCCLGASVVGRDYWRLLSDRRLSDGAVLCQLLARLLVLTAIPAAIYLTIFYIHLAVLSRAGPHDSVMTSAFQASLEVCPVFWSFLGMVSTFSLICKMFY
jgi:dolichyl-phosphate-mannose-protein mannosyltransferase